MRLGTTSQLILLAALAGLTLSLSPSPRAHLRIYRAFGKNLQKLLSQHTSTEPEEQRVRKSLHHLARQKYVQLTMQSKNDAGAVFVLALTKKGERALRGYHIRNIHIRPQKIWDKKWRLVIFDIPEKHRYARDILRDTLKGMGFFRIQQSVWAYPYPCKKEIELLGEYLGVTQSLFFFENRLARDEDLRKYFARQGIVL